MCVCVYKLHEYYKGKAYTVILSRQIRNKV